MGEVRVPAGPAGERPDPARGRELPDQRAAHRAAQLIRALGADQGRGGQRSTPTLGVLDAETRPRPSASAPREVADGELGRPLPDRRVPDRLGHLVSNMNANEVIATLAAERLGRPVHPTTTSTPASRATTCSRRRSTSPRPTAVVNDLIPALDQLAAALEAQGATSSPSVVKSRPHAPDGRHAGHAGPGVRRLRRAGAPRHRAARSDACRALAELPLGGTAVGTGINTPPGFAAAGDRRARASRPACRSPRRATTSRRRARATGWSRLSGQLRTIAVSLYKIANDIRWMGSGPRAGLREIHLPDLQPGSSIMPGKVNPVIPEAVLHGLRAGHRQRRRHRLRRRRGQLRAERHAADDGAQPPGVDPPAGQRLPAVRRPVRRRHRGQRRACARVRGGLARRSSRRSTATSATRRRPRSPSRRWPRASRSARWSSSAATSTSGKLTEEQLDEALDVMRMTGT